MSRTKSIVPDAAGGSRSRSNFLGSSAASGATASSQQPNAMPGQRMANVLGGDETRRRKAGGRISLMVPATRRFVKGILAAQKHWGNSPKSKSGARNGAHWP